MTGLLFLWTVKLERHLNRYELFIKETFHTLLVFPRSSLICRTGCLCYFAFKTF